MNKRKTEVEDLIGIDGESRSQTEEDFVKLISTWFDETIATALLNKIKGVDAWRKGKESKCIL